MLYLALGFVWNKSQVGSAPARQLAQCLEKSLERRSPSNPEEACGNHRRAKRETNANAAASGADSVECGTRSKNVTEEGMSMIMNANEINGQSGWCVVSDVVGGC